MKYVAVLSGKGGVGKTTTIVGAALALKAMGFNPAILDLDLENPSMGGQLGVTGFTRTNVSFQGDKIKPPEWCGIPIMSVSLLPMSNYEDTPTMVDESTKHWLIRQLVKEVDWGESDITLVDMPPGTGEEVRGLLQLGNDLAGGFLVTSPQALSEAAARKIVVMCMEYGLPLLGIVENEVNGVPGFAGHNLADAYRLPLLARVTWDRDIPQRMEVHEPFDHVPFMQVAQAVIDSVIAYAPTVGFERAAAPAIPASQDGVAEQVDAPEAAPEAAAPTSRKVPDLLLMPPEATNGFEAMTDEVWEQIKPLMPETSVRRPRVDDRMVVNGILWFYTTRISWKKMPVSVCRYQTALSRVKRWRVDGTWARVWEKAQELGYKPAAEGNGDTDSTGGDDAGVVSDGVGAGEPSGVGGEGEGAVSVGSGTEC